MTVESKGLPQNKGYAGKNKRQTRGNRDRQVNIKKEIDNLVKIQ